MSATRERDGRTVNGGSGSRRRAIRRVNHVKSVRAADRHQTISIALGYDRCLNKLGLLEESHFGQRRFKTRTGDADAHLIGRYGRVPAQQSFMTYRRLLVHCLPLKAIPNVDAEGLDTLAAMIHCFLQRNNVKGYGFRKFQRQRGSPLSRSSFPPCVQISIQSQRWIVRLVGIISGEFASGRKILVNVSSIT